MHKLPILTLMLLTLVSCHNSYDRRLTRAESKMNTHPDSALLLLDEISDMQNLSTANRAYYALEYTRACDKLGILSPNDSLINVAVEYYARHGNEKEQTLAYFYQGLVYRRLNSPDQALTAFLHSLKHVDESQPNRLLQIIYQNIGYLYYNQHLYSQSLEMYLKGYEVAETLQDSVLIANTSRYIGIDYEKLNQADSAMIYYHTTLSHTPRTDSMNQSTVLSDMAVCKQKTGYFQQAKSYINQSILLDDRSNPSRINFVIKGKILYKLNEIDSAYYYIKKGLANSNLEGRLDAYATLYQIEKIYKHDSLAFAAQDSMQHYQNLKEEKLHQEELMRRHWLHEQETMQQNYHSFLTMLVVAILCCILVITVLLYLYFKNRRKDLIASQEVTTSSEENVVTPIAHLKKTLNHCMAEFSQDNLFHELKTMDGSLPISNQKRQEIQQTIMFYFSDVVFELSKECKLSKDDEAYCIYLLFGFANNAIIHCSGVSESSIRSRKKRIKAKMNPELFNFITNANLFITK